MQSAKLVRAECVRNELWKRERSIVRVQLYVI